MEWLSSSVHLKDLEGQSKKRLCGDNSETASFQAATGMNFRPAPGVLEANRALNESLQIHQVKAQAATSTKGKEILYCTIGTSSAGRGQKKWTEQTCTVNIDSLDPRNYYEEFDTPCRLLQLFTPFADGSAAYNPDQAQNRGTGNQWDEVGVRNEYFSMGVFPTVLIEKDTVYVRPYGIYYASFEPSPMMMLHLPQWEYFPLPNQSTTDNVGLYMDMQLMGDVDTMKSVVSAINLCNPRPHSFVWVAPLDVDSSAVGYDVIAAKQMQWGEVMSEYADHMRSEIKDKDVWGSVPDKFKTAQEFIDFWISMRGGGSDYIRRELGRPYVSNLFHQGVSHGSTNGKSGGAEKAYRMATSGAPKDMLLQFAYNIVGAYYQIGGASLGLATIACFLNLPRMAYTGFVRRLETDHKSSRDIKGVKSNYEDLYSDQTNQDVMKAIRDFAPTAPNTLHGNLSSRSNYFSNIKELGNEATVAGLKSTSKIRKDPVHARDYSLRDRNNNWFGKVGPWEKFAKAKQETIRVARGTDLVETVDMLQFKCAWSLAMGERIGGGWPLMIPYNSTMDTPLAEVLKSDKFRQDIYLLHLLPNAYTMVQLEQGLQYKDVRTPILITTSVSGAMTLAATVFNSDVSAPSNVVSVIGPTRRQEQLLNQDLDAMYADTMPDGTVRDPEEIEREMNRRSDVRSENKTVRRLQKKKERTSSGRRTRTSSPDIQLPSRGQSKTPRPAVGVSKAYSDEFAQWIASAHPDPENPWYPNENLRMWQLIFKEEYYGLTPEEKQEYEYLKLLLLPERLWQATPEEGFDFLTEQYKDEGMDRDDAVGLLNKGNPTVPLSLQHFPDEPSGMWQNNKDGYLQYMAEMLGDRKPKPVSDPDFDYNVVNDEEDAADEEYADRSTVDPNRNLDEVPQEEEAEPRAPYHWSDEDARRLKEITNFRDDTGAFYENEEDEYKELMKNRKAYEKHLSRMKKGQGKTPTKWGTRQGERLQHLQGQPRYMLSDTEERELDDLIQLKKDWENSKRQAKKDQEKKQLKKKQDPFSTENIAKYYGPKRSRAGAASDPDAFAAKTTVSPTVVNQLYKMHRSVSQARTEEDEPRAKRHSSRGGSKHHRKHHSSKTTVVSRASGKYKKRSHSHFTKSKTVVLGKKPHGPKAGAFSFDDLFKPVSGAEIWSGIKSIVTPAIHMAEHVAVDIKDAVKDPKQAAIDFANWEKDRFIPKPNQSPTDFLIHNVDAGAETDIGKLVREVVPITKAIPTVGGIKKTVEALGKGDIGEAVVDAYNTVRPEDPGPVKASGSFAVSRKSPSIGNRTPRKSQRGSSMSEKQSRKRCKSSGLFGSDHDADFWTEAFNIATDKVNGYMSKPSSAIYDLVSSRSVLRQNPEKIHAEAGKHIRALGAGQFTKNSRQNNRAFKRMFMGSASMSMETQAMLDDFRAYGLRALALTHKLETVKHPKEREEIKNELRHTEEKANELARKLDKRDSFRRALHEGTKDLVSISPTSVTQWIGSKLIKSAGPYDNDRERQRNSDRYEPGSKFPEPLPVQKQSDRGGELNKAIKEQLLAQEKTQLAQQGKSQPPQSEKKEEGMGGWFADNWKTMLAVTALAGIAGYTIHRMRKRGQSFGSIFAVISQWGIITMLCGGLSGGTAAALGSEISSIVAGSGDDMSPALKAKWDHNIAMHKAFADTVVANVAQAYKDTGTTGAPLMRVGGDMKETAGDIAMALRALTQSYDTLKKEAEKDKKEAKDAKEEFEKIKKACEKAKEEQTATEKKFADYKSESEKKVSELKEKVKKLTQELETAKKATDTLQQTYNALAVNVEHLISQHRPGHGSSREGLPKQTLELAAHLLSEIGKMKAETEKAKETIAAKELKITELTTTKTTYTKDVGDEVKEKTTAIAAKLKEANDELKKNKDEVDAKIKEAKDKLEEAHKSALALERKDVLHAKEKQADLLATANAELTRLRSAEEKLKTEIFTLKGAKDTAEKKLQEERQKTREEALKGTHETSNTLRELQSELDEVYRERDDARARYDELLQTGMSKQQIDELKHTHGLAIQEKTATINSLNRQIEEMGPKAQGSQWQAEKTRLAQEHKDKITEAIRIKEAELQGVHAAALRTQEENLRKGFDSSDIQKVRQANLSLQTSEFQAKQAALSAQADLAILKAEKKAIEEKHSALESEFKKQMALQMQAASEATRSEFDNPGSVTSVIEQNAKLVPQFLKEVHDLRELVKTQRAGVDMPPEMHNFLTDVSSKLKSIKGRLIDFQYLGQRASKAGEGKGDRGEEEERRMRRKTAGSVGAFDIAKGALAIGALAGLGYGGYKGYNALKRRRSASRPKGDDSSWVMVAPGTNDDDLPPMPKPVARPEMTALKAAIEVVKYIDGKMTNLPHSSQKTLKVFLEHLLGRNSEKITGIEGIFTGHPQLSVHGEYKDDETRKAFDLLKSMAGNLSASLYEQLTIANSSNPSYGTFTWYICWLWVLYTLTLTAGRGETLNYARWLTADEGPPQLKSRTSLVIVRDLQRINAEFILPAVPLMRNRAQEYIDRYNIVSRESRSGLAESASAFDVAAILGAASLAGLGAYYGPEMYEKYKQRNSRKLSTQLFSRDVSVEPRAIEPPPKRQLGTFLTHSDSVPPTMPQPRTFTTSKPLNTFFGGGPAPDRQPFLTSRQTQFSYAPAVTHSLQLTPLEVAYSALYKIAVGAAHLEESDVETYINMMSSPAWVDVEEVGYPFDKPGTNKSSYKGLNTKDYHVMMDNFAQMSRITFDDVQQKMTARGIKLNAYIADTIAKCSHLLLWLFLCVYRAKTLFKINLAKHTKFTEKWPSEEWTLKEGMEFVPMGAFISDTNWSQFNEATLRELKQKMRACATPMATEIGEFVKKASFTDKPTAGSVGIFDVAKVALPMLAGGLAVHYAPQMKRGAQRAFTRQWNKLRMKRSPWEQRGGEDYEDLYSNPDNDPDIGFVMEMNRNKMNAQGAGRPMYSGIAYGAGNYDHLPIIGASEDNYSGNLPGKGYYGVPNVCVEGKGLNYEETLFQFRKRYIWESTPTNHAMMSEYAFARTAAYVKYLKENIDNTYMYYPDAKFRLFDKHTSCIFWRTEWDLDQNGDVVDQFQRFYGYDAASEEFHFLMQIDDVVRYKGFTWGGNVMHPRNEPFKGMPFAIGTRNNSHMTGEILRRAKEGESTWDKAKHFFGADGSFDPNRVFDQGKDGLFIRNDFGETMGPFYPSVTPPKAGAVGSLGMAGLGMLGGLGAAALLGGGYAGYKGYKKYARKHVVPVGASPSGRNISEIDVLLAYIRYMQREGFIDEDEAEGWTNNWNDAQIRHRMMLFFGNVAHEVSNRKSYVPFIREQVASAESGNGLSMAIVVGAASVGMHLRPVRIGQSQIPEMWNMAWKTAIEGPLQKFLHLWTETSNILIHVVRSLRNHGSATADGFFDDVKSGLSSAWDTTKEYAGKAWDYAKEHKGEVAAGIAALAALALAYKTGKLPAIAGAAAATTVATLGQAVTNVRESPVGQVMENKMNAELQKEMLIKAGLLSEKDFEGKPPVMHTDDVQAALLLKNLTPEQLEQVQGQLEDMETANDPYDSFGWGSGKGFGTKRPSRTSSFLKSKKVKTSYPTYPDYSKGDTAGYNAYEFKVAPNDNLFPTKEQWASVGMDGPPPAGSAGEFVAKPKKPRAKKPPTGRPRGRPKKILKDPPTDGIRAGSASRAGIRFTPGTKSPVRGPVREGTPMPSRD